MKKTLQRLLLLFAALAFNASAKDAALSMAYTNALCDELPFAIFSKGSWSPAPKARYVKLHLYFDDPIMVQGLEIDTCGSHVDPGLSLFFNFDQWVLHTDPTLTGEVPKAMYMQKKGDLLVLKNFDKSVEVRSLTFNFERSVDFKICGIHLKDPQGETYNIKTPALVAGSVDASSTLDPHSAYDPVFLFDSRFEYGWASNKQAKNVSLNFHFDRPQRVEKIRIWNGYQRSVGHCQANSRAKVVKLTGDGGYSEEISVRDILGAQVIALPKPFTGKELKFEIADSYIGKSYPDLVISELRFFDGGQWFMLDPAGKLKDGIEANRTQFARAHADALLNQSYLGEYQYKEGADIVKGTDTTLRLRADGSFYIASIDDPENGEAARYFALGNYEIKDADPQKGLSLRLFGLFYRSEQYGDCNGCGRDCNKNATLDDGSIQKIFQTFVTIRPTVAGKFTIVNETRKYRGNLPFDKRELSLETPK